MASDFGKEVGLVHKAIVAGRKFGADTEFWTALADNDEALEVIVPLARHIAEATKRISFNNSFRDDTKSLTKWIRSLSRRDPWSPSIPMDLVPERVKKEEWGQDVDVSDKQAVTRTFLKELVLRIGNMGLGVYELRSAAKNDCFIYSNDGHKIVGMKGELRLHELVMMIKKLIAQRQLIQTVLYQLREDNFYPKWEREED